ncbi:MAG: hypothetical protein VX738_13760 [Planctomycetota bacterium]|nr:hypothetical protein [Planctomycetota bacterium]
MVEQLASSQSKRSPAIWHPIVDFLLVGGASVIGGITMMVWFFFHPEWIEGFNRFAESGPQPRDLNDVYLFWLLTLLINNPHFMASYRLLYRSQKQIRTYRWSSIWIPLLLLVVGISAVMFLHVPAGNGTNPTMGLTEMNAQGWSYSIIVFLVLSVLTVVYLGWHYNLQGWGMTASFAYMHGIRFADGERRMIKSGFLAMVVTHAVLYLSWSPLMEIPFWSDALVQLTLLLPILGGFSLILGILGFMKASQRTGKKIPINAITPWFTCLFWYYMVMNYHYVLGIAVFVQIAHALQYLSFTTRVERNLLPKQAGVPGWARWSLIMAGLVFCGWLVFEGSNVIPQQASEASKLYFVFALELLVISINIHHFFVDGAIWKISNPEVRTALFAHLRGSE